MFCADDSCFPFVVNTWSGVISDDDLADRTAWQDEVVKRGQNWVTLSDCRALVRPDGDGRRRIAETMNRLNARVGPQMVATAFVFESSLVANALKAIRWTAPAPIKETYVSRVGDGYAWLKKQAARVDVVVPAEAAALVQRLIDDGPQRPLPRSAP